CGRYGIASGTLDVW
nr:immunoglobulin heavy chain junction region [Macaca mulatta]MOW47897.1 immunoglobulin heavy chain junction region [Macaca mulatta]MOW48195.1 immunoglobulin heavy chain junction region [Macaca mulatta]MOW50739.1 immunoglobulin heavy chain junction region [Macaca mulatta]